MASLPEGPGKRVVIHTAASRMVLASIYFYNETSYGEAHADRFLAFVENRLRAIAEQPNTGRFVADMPGIQCSTIKKSAKRSSFGYRVFYRTTQEGIEVIRILHTRMSWNAQELESG